MLAENEILKLPYKPFDDRKGKSAIHATLLFICKNFCCRLILLIVIALLAFYEKGEHGMLEVLCYLRFIILVHLI